ncbi:hypothetical protein CR194_03250 [Salipaludibacillus keqinensis]|uniref:Uncharacterized protein n=1 Tax=Salipaludibacillus keqinensis TaxID=2045207 RepID=A0A323TKR4_9BACI|nr:hypothetical protein [Salipaludibacillus keqinensis]PYZ94564.1 hypothetical protein CR194_03250 [Salipaludibacillus keqinensis]
MTREQLIQQLEEKNMKEILELIEDAEAGHLEELELAPSLGLLRDTKLNDAVLNHLSQQGVNIIYVNEDDE